MDKRYQRSHRTRKTLLKAAKKVFLKNGYQKTTVQNINKEAETGHGTIYSHFPSGKDEVLAVIMEEIMDEFYAVADITFAPETTEEAYQIIRKQLFDFISLAHKHREALAVFYEGIGISPLLKEKWMNIITTFEKRIQKDTQYSQNKGLAKQDLDYRVVAKLLLSVGEHFLWETVTGHNNLSVEKIADNVTKVYLHGLYKPNS